VLVNEKHGRVHAGLQLFAEMAPKSTTEGDWLTLPDGVHFLGDSSLGRSGGLHRAGESPGKLEGEGHRPCRHQWKPRTGKSWFAIYMLVGCGSASLHIAVICYCFIQALPESSPMDLPWSAISLLYIDLTWANATLASL